MAASSNFPIGTNIKASLNGSKLTLEIDLSERHGVSGSGKSDTVASTGAPCPLPGADGTIRIGVNVFAVHPKTPKVG